MKKFILGLTLLISALFLASCSKALVSNNASKIVVVGLDDTFAPMGFKNEKGEIVGFDVDLAKEVFKRLGYEVKFQPIDWAMKESELNSKKIDAIWNGYTITEERKEKVDFTKPYLVNRQVIVVLKDSIINKKSDLEGKRVAAQLNSSSQEAVEKDKGIVSKFKDGKLNLYETNNDALMELESGRIDAVVVDEILARYYIKLKGEDKFKILEDNFGEEEYGIGFRKGDELKDKVDKTLEEMKKDGTFEKIYSNWFKK
ncbi:MAG: extracellular solute-binding protein family 3 [Caloramator sp.]|jgi:polar amino acid transport system substrate-binding protein|uniref:amino acid ABC transporter substrate-binding protein n=1 Tax=Caloramator sp. TaxID=1871330 RepID=UPI001D70109E|nr:amino acid ABC transporter substrate-binding protein [Caloramator sp.]MBZ4662579.1 extracellular solute-binding protein family 3 [Caloramator sp.]